MASQFADLEHLSKKRFGWQRGLAGQEGVSSRRWGLMVLYGDVTERHETRRRFQESEARFRAAVDAVGGIIWTNDASGQMQGDQLGWQSITGQSREEYESLPPSLEVASTLAPSHSGPQI